MMALLVASQYMARVNPQVADRAVFLAHGQCPPEDESSHGLRTVQHLFATGARFLKRLVYLIGYRVRLSVGLCLQV